MTDIHDLTKDEIRERTMEKFASMVYYVTNESLDVFSLRMQVSLHCQSLSSDVIEMKADLAAHRHRRSCFLDPLRRQLRAVPRGFAERGDC
jgi:hypothetical protein